MPTQPAVTLLQALHDLASLGQPRICAAGEAVHRQGMMPEGIVWVRQGRLRLETTASSGKTLVLGTVASGEILGLDAALASNPFHCTSIALEPCELLLIPREQFLRLLENTPGARLEVLHLLSTDLCAQHRRIRHLNACGPDCAEDGCCAS
jgi:CRP/FNR family transcriptional regulator, cyclic AMP receptor protein